MEKSELEKLSAKEFVSLSARLMAAFRARENSRSERLFDDPFSAKLAGADAFDFLAKRTRKPEEQGKPYIEVRTRFFDDFIRTRLGGSPQISQIVILGAGLDTRGFRLPWSKEIILYEIDRQEVLDYKNKILKNNLPNCQRRVIFADLIVAPWLDLLYEAGYSAEKPSLWLLEGLSMYLSSEEVHQLLATISSATGEGSWLGLDMINERGMKHPHDKIFQGYFRSGFDRPEDLLAKYNWEAEVIEPGDEKAHYDRYTKKAPPREVPGIARRFFVVAKKQ